MDGGAPTDLRETWLLESSFSFRALCQCKESQCYFISNLESLVATTPPTVVFRFL